MTDLEGRVRVSHSDDGVRSRPAVFFRLILLIPHLIWITLWTIGAALVLPVHWVGALILGRPMGWAHAFYSAFVRYALNLHAYWYLAADRYPPFIGEPGYVVDAAIPEPGPQRRWTIALRLFLGLPPFLLAAALTNGIGGSFTTGSGSDATEASLSLNVGLGVAVAVVAWFASLALARTPQGLRDAQVYCLGYATQAYAYLLLLTERYPTSDPRAVALEPMPEHPVTLPDPDDDLTRNRWVVLFRLPLAFPHLVWLTIWALGAFIVAVFGWFAALFTTRLPVGWHSFLAGFVRYGTHVTSFVYVLGGPFPGFLGRAGSYPVDPRIEDPRQQARAKTAFRLILAFPALMVASAFSTVLLVGCVGAWWAALVTGRVPDGLHRLLSWGVRYQAQAYSYLLLLTDRYPYTGPDGSGRAEASTEPAEPSGLEAWQHAPEAPQHK